MYEPRPVEYKDETIPLFSGEHLTAINRFKSNIDMIAEYSAPQYLRPSSHKDGNAFFKYIVGNYSFLVVLILLSVLIVPYLQGQPYTGTGYIDQYLIVPAPFLVYGLASWLIVGLWLPRIRSKRILAKCQRLNSLITQYGYDLTYLSHKLIENEDVKGLYCIKATVTAYSRNDFDRLNNFFVTSQLSSNFLETMCGWRHKEEMLDNWIKYTIACSDLVVGRNFDLTHI